MEHGHGPWPMPMALHSKVERVQSGIGAIYKSGVPIMESPIIIIPGPRHEILASLDSIIESIIDVAPTPTVSLISETPRIAANRHESPHRHESPRTAVFAQHSSFFHACVRLRMARVCEVPNFRSTFQS